MTLDEISSRHFELSARDQKISRYPVLSANHALDFMTEALDGGYRLLGVEGFHLLEGNKIQPDQRLSLDVDEFQGSTISEFNGQVTDLLSQNLHNPKIVFEVVFEDTANS